VGLGTVQATSHLAGTDPPVVTEIRIVALLEQAQCQNRLCPRQTPALAYARHPVLHDSTAGRLHHAGPDGKACRKVRVVVPPAPVVLEARDDVREHFPLRLAQPLLGEAVAQAADDIASPASAHLRQLRPHPTVSSRGSFPPPRVRSAPEVADDRHHAQDTRHTPPLLAQLGGQVPQVKGAIETDDPEPAVHGLPALGVGVGALPV